MHNCSECEVKRKLGRIQEIINNDKISIFALSGYIRKVLNDPSGEADISVNCQKCAIGYDDPELDDGK